VISRFAELSDRATPVALDGYLRSEVAKWAPIIKAAGVSAD
jgi:tripartite-type tricarboxylate transporter receptor subunit TctC